MKQSTLTRLLRVWRKRIPMISPWKIRIRLERADKMDGTLGRCDMYVEMQMAQITILHPDDRNGKPEESNPEVDLIHELLHIVLDGHCPQQRYSVPHEVAINALSETLYRAYHKNS